MYRKKEDITIVYTADFIKKVLSVCTQSMTTITERPGNMPLKKQGFCQSHAVNLRTKTRVLYFEETWFFGIIY